MRDGFPLCSVKFGGHFLQVASDGSSLLSSSEGCSKVKVSNVNFPACFLHRLAPNLLWGKRIQSLKVSRSPVQQQRLDKHFKGMGGEGVVLLHRMDFIQSETAAALQREAADLM